MNSVSPEDTNSSSISGLRSKKRTRFLDLLGIARGVNIYLDLEASRLVPTVVPLFLLTTPDRSLSVIVEWFPESAIIR